MPVLDAWGLGTLTSPDPPREEQDEIVTCDECPAEIDLVADVHATITTWNGRQAHLCKHCGEMTGLL
jgi:hypothetical protein